MYHLVVCACSWKGPYRVSPTPIFAQQQEDPYLWYQPETSSFHALFHNMGGCADVGCHAFSPDGLHWTSSAVCAACFTTCQCSLSSILSVCIYFLHFPCVLDLLSVLTRCVDASSHCAPRLFFFPLCVTSLRWCTLRRRVFRRQRMGTLCCLMTA